MNPDFKQPYHNVYYPSPEMQEVAADVLVPEVLKLLETVGQAGGTIGSGSQCD
jgi:hypothetical protein